MKTWLLLTTAASVLAWADRIQAESPATAIGVNSNAWHYTLLPGSLLIDDCYCGRPTLTYPMSGSFALRWVGEDPLFAQYALENISFEAGTAGLRYKVTG